MPLRNRGERVETGIWQGADGQGYVAEVSYRDPQTGRRVREVRRINRLDLARDWRHKRREDALRGELDRRKGAGRAPCFGAFAGEYLESWSKVEKAVSSYERDRTSLKHLRAYFGKRQISSIVRRDVDLRKGQKGIITVRKTKNYETRYIPMNTRVWEALQHHSKRIVDGKVCRLVFSNEAGEAYTDIRGGFNSALRRVGVDRHIRFHDLRHTFASHLVMAGENLQTVAKLLGHRDIRVTMRYAHLAPEHLQAAVDRLTEQPGRAKRSTG